MRKTAIILNVVLLIVVFAGLAIARRQGKTLTYADFLLPCFGIVLLLSLTDTTPLKATNNQAR
ncbi:MAG: hypothetical protein KF805_02825 [Phycisphaeraceae bacterium]|nr:hypothetical protein [Phycisphaeraceae bacterium]